MTERFAIYYAPSTDSALWQKAEQWLNADVLSRTQTQIDPEEFLAATQSARRYGFHATIMAPMRLAPGKSAADLITEIAAYAKSCAPVELGTLELHNLGGFLALIPKHQSAELTKFAGTTLSRFQNLRAPLTDIERRKRLAAGLSQHQTELLDQYGYPYVMDEFRVHLTLTDKLSEPHTTLMRDLAQDWFGPVLNAPFWLDRLVIYREPAPGADFIRENEFLLTGAQRTPIS